MRHKMCCSTVAAIIHEQGHARTRTPHIHTWKHGNVGVLQTRAFSCLSHPATSGCMLGYTDWLQHVTEDFDIKLSINFVHVLLCPAPDHHKSHVRDLCIRIPVHCLKSAGHQELKGIETQTSFALNVNIIPLQITIHALFLLRFKGKKNSDYSFQAYIFKFV